MEKKTRKEAIEEMEEKAEKIADEMIRALTEHALDWRGTEQDVIVDAELNVGNLNKCSWQPCGDHGPNVCDCYTPEDFAENECDLSCIEIQRAGMAEQLECPYGPTNQAGNEKEGHVWDHDQKEWITEEEYQDATRDFIVGGCVEEYDQDERERLVEIITNCLKAVE